MSILKSILYGAATIAALAFTGGHRGRAATILSEAFETPALAANITTGNSIFNAAVSGGSFTAQNDTGSGAFTGTQFMRYLDTTSAPNLRATFAPITGVFQLSWDYFEPNATIAGTATHFRMLLSSGNSGTTTNRAVDLLLSAPNDGVATNGQVTNWNDGLTNLAAYSTDSLVHFDIVGNVGASTTYAGGDLPTQTFDLYFNGALVGDNLAFRAPNDGGSALSQIDELGVGFPSGSASRVQTVFVDNIALHDIAVIPEPYTCVLAGMGVLGFGLIRKYRMKSI